MGDFFNSLLSLLKKPSPILVSVSIATGALIFLDQSYLKKLFLLDFRNQYGIYIGITFMISTSILLMYCLMFSYRKILEPFELAKLKKIRVKNLLSLNQEQLYTVIQIYYRPNHSANLDISQSLTTTLEYYQIIGRASQIGVAFTYFSYFLQPWVVEYIRKNPNFTQNLPKGEIPNEWVEW
jgi:hypothetical protein